MPKLCDTPLARILFAAAELSVTDPVRDVCRQRVAEMRDQYDSAADMARALGCSQRHLRRLLLRYGVRRWRTDTRAGAKAFEAPARPRGWNLGVRKQMRKQRETQPATTQPPHPPASFCSCEWCLRARGAA